MATVNSKLAEASINHSIDLQHFANGVVERILALLNRVDDDLAAQIATKLMTLPPESFTVQRLDKLLASVRELNQAVYSDVQAAIAPELKALAEYEAGYQLQLFNATIPAQISTLATINAIDFERVYTGAMARPFQGRLLKEWMAGLEESRAVRVRDTIRMGYVESKTVPQIVQSIRGTRAKGFADGILEIDRRNAESVVRTAVMHFSGETRDRFHEANDDLVKAVQWVSTLDTRTTPICIARDGKSYTNITHKPIGHSLPWLGGAGKAHWNCRSSSIAILKSYKDLGIDYPEPLDSTTRASMDGAVDANLTYKTWLQQQSLERQTEVLGKKQALEFRKTGELPDKFENDKSRTLTIKQLKARDAKSLK
jgi:hypothetical protein